MAAGCSCPWGWAAYDDAGGDAWLRRRWVGAAAAAGSACQTPPAAAAASSGVPRAASAPT